MKQTAKYFFSAIALFFTNIPFSQTGPGGVGNNTNVALWLDAHTMGGTSGTKVSNWVDYSGNNINASESDESNQPFYMTNALNGRNAIDFQSAQCLTTGANPLMDNINQFKYYMVANIDDASALTIPFNVDYGSAGADAVFTGILTQSGNMDAYGRAGGSLIRADYSSAIGLHTFSAEYNMNSTDLFCHTDFNQDDVNPSLSRNTSTHEEFWIGGTKSFGSSNYFIDGQIGELFVFTTTLNTAQENILQNYLSAKFGMTATNDMYTYEANHGLGLVGIGQEDVSNLHTNSIGNGYVRISSPTSLNSGDYLFVGHNDVDISALSANVPSSMPAGSERFNRTWRAQKTGDLGNITLTFELDAESNFSSNPSSYQLIVDTDSDFSNATELYTGVYDAGNQTITFSGVDLSTGEFFTLAGETISTIASVQTGNWSNPSTWDCNCIPTAFNDVTITAGHAVTIDQNAFTKELNIQNTASLIMSTDLDLSISKDFLINGSVNLTAGKVIMAGSEDQWINSYGNPAIFHDLEINNTSASNITLVSAEYTLQGTLAMESGHLTIQNNAGGILIVDSQSEFTSGRIGEIKYGCTITGDVRVLRYIPAGTAGWRNLSSPVTNATLADWDQGLIISGDGFPDGCAAIGQNPCFYSVVEWVNGVSNDITSINAPLENGHGYEVYVGDDEYTYAGGTAVVEGTLNDNASVAVSVDWGWNTMGNPYASPILFSTINRNHVDNYFYVYDASTGGYQWYDGLTNTSSVPSLANGLIGIGQGFWTFDYGTLTYEQKDKVDQTATFIKATEEEDMSMYFKLSENNSTYCSTIAFQEHQDCADGFDTLRDMRHMIRGDEKAPGFAIDTDVDYLTKNWINSSVETKSFDLYTEFKNDGYYTIESKNLAAFNHYPIIKIYDKLNAEYIDLKKETSFVFYSQAGIQDRFTLVLSNELDTQDTPVSTVGMMEEDNISITQMGNILRIESDADLGENVQLNLYNVAGQQMVYSIEKSINSGTTTIELPTLNSGIYVLSISNGTQQISKKMVF